MLQHQKNTRTMYEFAIANEAGETLLQLWTICKSIRKAQRLCIVNAANIEKATNTNAEEWTFTPSGIENKSRHMAGKHTGRTLLEARGYKGTRP
jgi:hypothetical protein